MRTVAIGQHHGGREGSMTEERAQTHGKGVMRKQ